MKISRNSWHYRLQTRFFHTIPTNLCQYVWRLLWSVLWSLVFGLGVIIIGLFAIGILICVVWSWILAFQGQFMWNTSTEHSMYSVVGLGFMVTISIVVTFFICLLGKIYGKLLALYPKQKKKIKKTKSRPNIFYAWLKAKKEKICPLIEYDD